MGERVGQYELLAPLAQGGAGEVFLARFAGEGGFEKLVVVKRLFEHLSNDSEFVDMFLDEARLGARLEQANIVQTIELGQDDGQYFIAMEYVPGMSLAQLGRKAGRRSGGLPPAVTLALAVQACAGLHHAHERREPDGTPLRIVHRDISPQNLIVTYEGVLKIVDFGIAHASAQARDARTKAGFIKGKFAYMAPEQCVAKPVDARSDVFALGVVTHELLTGRRLFKRDTTYKTYQAILAGEVTRPSEVNPALGRELDAPILKALAMRPEERFQSAEELGEALQALLYRMGHTGSAAEIARYLEKHFQPEIAEHEEMLRRVFAGQSTSFKAARWDGDGEDAEPIEELSVNDVLSGVSDVGDISGLVEGSFTPLDDGAEDEPDDRPLDAGGEEWPTGRRTTPHPVLMQPLAAPAPAAVPAAVPAAAAAAVPAAAAAAVPAAAAAAAAVPAAAVAAAPAPLASVTATPIESTRPAPAMTAPRRASAETATAPEGVAALASGQTPPLADGSHSYTVATAPATRPLWVYVLAFVLAAGAGFGLLALARAVF